MIVSSRSLATAMQRDWDYGVQSELTGRESFPSIRHKAPKEWSQATQILILELVNGLAQRPAVKRIGPEPVELDW